jgi:hypothetical protein
MPRIFDSSHLTQRKAERTIAGGFLSNGTAPMSRPLLGIKDSSILYAVKSGSMTQYTQYTACVGVSPGCPCPQLNAVAVISPFVPEPVPEQISGVIFTIGSIHISWNPVNATSYIITPYLNGVALPSVTTENTYYRFTGLNEMQPYTFTICGVNSFGQGPIMTTASFMAPPQNLSPILQGVLKEDISIDPSLNYIINTGLNYIFGYAMKNGTGPTIISRIMYISVASVVQSWNWVTSDVYIEGIHDNWNWDVKGTILTECESIIWICSIIDYITPKIIGKYTSIYNCSQTDVAAVKQKGNWDTFIGLWNTWYNYRKGDGAASAITTMPILSDNWEKTIVVDNHTVTDFSNFTRNPNNPDTILLDPVHQYTRLTVDGIKKGYLTYNWDKVLPTCIIDEDDILASVSPAMGEDRDVEIDAMLRIVGNLTPLQKIEAEFWAGSAMGTISPPLMSIWLWKEYIRLIGTKCHVTMYSLLDMAIHMFEAGRITWGVKAHWMQARPIQEIRRRYNGQMVKTWNGDMNGNSNNEIDGSQWVPYQASNFVTPPFPDFTSGHSAFTKGFALVMNKWFPIAPNSSFIKNEIIYDTLECMSTLFKNTQSAPYGDFVISPGSSTIEKNVPVMAQRLSFRKWDEIAESAGMSRLYGGIHTISAHTAAQAVAVEVDGFINIDWNIRFT